jgi:hypothetical protein
MSHSRDKGKSGSDDKKKPHLSIKEKRKLKREKQEHKPVIPHKE